MDQINALVPNCEYRPAAPSGLSGTPEHGNYGALSAEIVLRNRLTNFSSP